MEISTDILQINLKYHCKVRSTFVDKSKMSSIKKCRENFHQHVHVLRRPVDFSFDI